MEELGFTSKFKHYQVTLVKTVPCKYFYNVSVTAVDRYGAKIAALKIGDRPELFDKELFEKPKTKVQKVKEIK